MDSTTLHTMARRYLMSRDEKLHAEYATLANDGRNSFVLGYTKEARRIFPRYNVVAAMLREVERLDPDDLPPSNQLASALATIAVTAQSDVTRPRGRTEAEAIGAERERFRESIKSWSTARNLVVEPLGYRRVLSDEESAHWRRELTRRWGLDGTMWHPLITADVPEDVLVVDASAMYDGPGIQLVRESLAGMNRHRVIEIREPGDPDSRLDLDLFEPTYTGAEGVWTDETHDWIAYASHEHSVAFGGTLAERLRTSWPDLADWGWTPWWDQPAK